MDKINLISVCDIIIICLPTPLKKNYIPDVSELGECLKNIHPHLRNNQMLILESTVYPNATKEIFEKKISKSFIIGKNFNLCFSPERISPGQNYLLEYSNITKLISGRTNKCLENISSFYKKIFKNIYKCKSIEIAEFTKLYENAYRAVNIGLANQIKMICDKMKINIFDVINAAKTKPFGFTPFSPGPGVGGHCIPIDPLFISYAAKKLKVNCDFIETARKVNIDITKWTINKIKKNIHFDKKILILGVAYKKNIDDIRESPSLKILDQLNKTHKVNFFDPHVSKINYKNVKYSSIDKLNYKNLNKYAGVVIVTDHDFFDYKKILRYSQKIFDTRGIYANISSKKIITC